MVVSKQSGEFGFRFCWLSPGEVPFHLDLRRCGWTFDEHRRSGQRLIGILDGKDAFDDEAQHASVGRRPVKRRSVLVAGVECPDERAMLLQMGYGDVVPRSAHIGEIAARGRRMADFIEWVPRRRQLGELKLDLVSRDVSVHGRPLSLNAREFALIWRLADDPNRAVTKQALIKDVWRMAFVPRTNSVAVHMSRLRSKLAQVGLDQIIETSPEGGYLLRIQGEAQTSDPARSAYSAPFAAA